MLHRVVTKTPRSFLLSAAAFDCIGTHRPRPFLFTSLNVISDLVLAFHRPEPDIPPTTPLLLCIFLSASEPALSTLFTPTDSPWPFSSTSTQRPPRCDPVSAGM